MIIQHAILNVTAGQGGEFEKAFKQAEQVMGEAKGFQFVDLLRGVPSKDTYLLIVAWDSLDDDLTGFRESELYGRWNDLLSPYLGSEPEHTHFELLSHYTGGNS